ncbi:MAG: hypothetical protein J6W00_10035 [Lentisphaeria bacterium]|nr:hypothetical protein [Lentisphaeria bacterium]
MQNTIFYVAAYETLGVVRDYANARNTTAPTLVRGVEACLKMRLFAEREGLDPYPISALKNVVAWHWAMDNDFNHSTSYKLIGDNGNITVKEVTVSLDEEEITYTEITIPISHMNTVELGEWLGIEKSKTGLHGELVGFDVNGKEIFIVQIENFTIRNRISSLDDPDFIEDGSMTESQVNALISAGIECEFSEDTSSWHVSQTLADKWMHIRLRSNASGVWSNPISLIAGPKGDQGECSYCYVAYASDVKGSDFSLIPADNLKYRAEIYVSEKISVPAIEDFADAVWVKYIGDDGSGVGDMTKSVYDPNNDGKVSSSENADHANSANTVPWNGVSDKPSSFPPSEHSHMMQDIKNIVSQPSIASSSTTTLYTGYPIVQNTRYVEDGIIKFDFRSICNNNGTRYTLNDREMLTWEYHAWAMVPVTGVTLGNEYCTVIGINIPERLELIQNYPTCHVFVIRAIYKTGCINNICFQANYAYSYRI